MPKWTKKEKKHKNDKIWSIIWYKKKDVKADIELAFKKIPLEQTKAMIDFFERLDIDENEKINIIWNSLGWALWQIMMKMYPENFKKWIFPHSPWASDLSLEKADKLEDKYKKLLENYFKTKKIDAEIIYVDWENSFRPISWFWKKLQSKNTTKQYSVSWWKLHFMPQLIKFMKNLQYWDIVKVREKS
jgi:pimeloyl-ACP methyl ester carboxylesterase